MTAVSTIPRGLTAARVLRALALADGDPLAARAFAEAQGWDRDTPDALRWLKAAVGSLDSTTAAALMAPAGYDLAEAVRPATIIGRLQGPHRVPLMTALLGTTSGAAASWSGEGAAKPIDSMAFSGPAVLAAHKVTGVAVASVEVLRLSTPSAEQAILAEVARAIVEAVDRAFVDPSNDGSSGAPPAVTYDATAVQSTGADLAQIDADLKLAIAALSASSTLASAAWIMSTRSLTHLASLRGSGGAYAYPGLNVRNGGFLLGLPVIASGNVPISSDSAQTTSIALLDCDAVAIADESETELSTARSASLQMDSEPSTGAQALVSLWQNNLVGLRAERFLSWAKRRATAAVVLTNVSY